MCRRRNLWHRESAERNNLKSLWAEKGTDGTGGFGSATNFGVGSGIFSVAVGDFNRDGNPDLAVTRFSGKRAPERPGADHVQREAYSHECISAGFWPGSGSLLAPAYYAYTAPVPAGLGNAPVRPAAAHYDHQLGEFILLYDDVRNAADPRATLLDFLQSTYEAGANLSGWDRSSLER
jgi:hypothetical protein